MRLDTGDPHLVSSPLAATCRAVMSAMRKMGNLSLNIVGKRLNSNPNSLQRASLTMCGRCKSVVQRPHRLGEILYTYKPRLWPGSRKTLVRLLIQTHDLLLPIHNSSTNQTMSASLFNLSHFNFQSTIPSFNLRPIITVLAVGTLSLNPSKISTHFTIKSWVT